MDLYYKYNGGRARVSNTRSSNYELAELCCYGHELIKNTKNIKDTETT